MRGENIKFTANENKNAWLWFCKINGWQVTSFNPKDDPAIGVKKDAKLFVSENQLALTYDQGRKDAIDEVLGLLRSKDGREYGYGTCPDIADWLEGKFKVS